MSRQILKIKDKTDSYYTKLKDIFDLPMRLVIVGKSQLSGKSTIILNLLLRDSFYAKSFKGENIYLISNNKLDNKLKILQEMKQIPDQNIFEYDEEKLEVLYEMLEDEFMAAVAENEKPDNILLVFDDVAYSGNLKNKTTGIVSKLVMNGRHANISTIFTTQKYSLISTGVRSNVTGAILFGNSAKELELMTEDYNYLNDRKLFQKMYRNATRERNSFLVVNFSNDSGNLYLDSEFKPIKIADV